MITHTQSYINKKNAALSKTSKICIHCKQEKPISFYSTDRKHLDGKHPICKDCKKIEQRELYKKQPHLFKESNKRAYEKFTEKHNARHKLNYAVKTGKITKPKACSICGVSGVRIEGHHYKGYNYPYNVIWLCTPCHNKEDLKTK